MDESLNSTGPYVFDANGGAVSCTAPSSTLETSAQQLRPQLFARFQPIAYVSGVGHFLPPTEVTNADLASTYGLRFPNLAEASSAEFSAMVFSKTGILSRRHALDGPTLAEFAVAAAQHALSEANLNAGEITHIVLGSTYLGAEAATIAQEIRNGLGNQNCSVEILLQACASSGFCVERAVAILRDQPDANHVLAIGADKGSSFIDFTDTGTAILFGDGAGALVVSRRPQDDSSVSGILLTTSDFFPQFGEYIFLNQGGKMEMPNGTGVFREACTAVKSSIKLLLAAAGLVPEQVDRYLLHQANTKLPAHIASALQLPPEKVLTNIRFRGNTCAASPIILASEAVQNGLVRPGDITIIGAVGVGMKSSAVLLSW